MARNSMTAKERENLEHILKLTGTNGRHRLDLRDGKQWEFLMSHAESTGATPQKNPRYFESLERSRAAHERNGGPAPIVARTSEGDDDVESVNDINSFGINDQNTNSVGGAASSIVGGTVYTSLQLQMFDVKTGDNLGYQQVGPVYGQGKYLPISLLGDLPGVNDGMRLVFTYSYQEEPGSDPIHEVMARETNELPKGAPVVAQPVKTVVSANNYIKIGLGRTSAPTDCDYWYNENQIANPTIRLPFVGYQDFNSNIITPLFPTSGPPNCIVTAFLTKPSTGGAAMTLPITTSNFATYITASGNRLNWNFTYNNNVSLDKSAQFGQAAWANDSQLLLTWTMQVRTQTSAGEWVFVNIVSRTTPPWSTSSAPGNYRLYPIYYTWHCVAAGTLVTRADGSTIKIEDIVGGERVKVGPGNAVFTVVDTFGTNKEAEVLAFETDLGHKLLITDMHPVRTDGGIVLAKDLAVGSTVLTDKGASKLTSVRRQPYSGLVYCIGLGTAAEEQQFTPDNTCFYANGILVGDNRICVEYVMGYEPRLETILARLPEDWHEEARSAYAAQQNLKG